MLFDTEFLIRRAGQRGAREKARTTGFLSAHPASALYNSRVCWSEFAEGFNHRADADDALSSFAILEIDDSIAWQASRVARALVGKGLHIGDNDIWIAATALEFGLPLVSNNQKHFARVPGLKVAAY